MTCRRYDGKVVVAQPNAIRRNLRIISSDITSLIGKYNPHWIVTVIKECQHGRISAIFLQKGDIWLFNPKGGKL
jgi:hypothetical protein